MNRILITSLFLYTTIGFFNNKSIKAGYNKRSTQTDTVSIYGSWKIISYTPGYISALTDEEAKKYIGKTITLKPDLATVINDTCNQPIFKSTIQNSDQYFYESRIDKATLKIKSDSIRIIEIDCENPKYSDDNSPNFLYDFITVNKDLMIVSFNGVYFHLKRIRSF